MSQAVQVAEVRRVRVALAGNPNVGKSAVFNALTGGRAFVGNWPGVTVERKVGYRRVDGLELEVVDLPGTYSLSGQSVDEKIAKNYIVNERPDVVVNVVSAANLERNLYLTLLLAEAEVNLVIALNMIDVAESQGYRVNAKRLEELLGVPVVPMVAIKGVGARELLDAIVEAVKRPRKPRRISYGREVEEAISRIAEVLAKDPELSSKYSLRWLAIRLLEGDEDVVEVVKASRIGGEVLKIVEEERRKLERAYGDVEAFIASRRFEAAARIARSVLEAVKPAKVSVTDVIDAVLAHRLAGLLAAIAFLYLVFRFAFEVSAPFSTLIDLFFNDWLYGLVESAPIDEALKSFLADGVIAGIGSVLVFLPVIAFFYIGLAVLEDVGYMARIAFVLDRLVSGFGVSGKAIIPLIIGFGCNVPAVMATRTIEDENERKTAALMAPFASCTARLPVYLVVGGALFAAEVGLVVLSLYALGIAVALLTALLLRRTVFSGPSIGFIMELPPYLMPSLRNVGVKTWERTKRFLIKAGVVIFAAVVLTWLLSVTGPAGWLGPMALEDPELLGESWMGVLGKALQPLFAPMGWDWRAIAALAFGFIAKENVVSTMAVLYGVAGEEELHTVLAKVFTPVTAYAYLVFVLLYVPCAATLATIRGELGWKYALLALGYEIAVAYIAALAVVGVGSLLAG